MKERHKDMLAIGVLISTGVFYVAMMLVGLLRGGGVPLKVPPYVEYAFLAGLAVFFTVLWWAVRRIGNRNDRQYEAKLMRTSTELDAMRHYLANGCKPEDAVPMEHMMRRGKWVYADDLQVGDLIIHKAGIIEVTQVDSGGGMVYVHGRLQAFTPIAHGHDATLPSHQLVWTVAPEAPRQTA